MPKRAHTYPLGIIGIVLCAGMLLAGWWPMDFLADNHVRWLKDRDGVEFFDRASIYNPEPLFATGDYPFEKGRISFELLIQSDLQSERTSSPLLYIFGNQKDTIFSIIQKRSDLVVCTEGENKQGNWSSRYKYFDDVIQPNRVLHIAVTSSEDKIDIYLDGERVNSTPDWTIPIKGPHIFQYLLLGTGKGGKNFWTGRILGLAVYSEVLTAQQILSRPSQALSSECLPPSQNESLVLSYHFKEREGEWTKNEAGSIGQLHLPSRLKGIDYGVLNRRWRRLIDPTDQDVLLNILFFIPFGFWWAAYFRTRSRLSLKTVFLTAFVLGGGISLCIELAQCWLRSRDACVEDLICNTFGSGIGCLLFMFLSHKSETGIWLKKGQKLDP